MIEPVIADASAIVGFLSESDQCRDVAYRYFQELPKPFWTCEAAITESCFLMSGTVNGVQRVLNLVATNVLRLDFSLMSEVNSVAALMLKYSSVPMSLADACLIRMGESMKNSVVFTFDADFRIYRKHGKHMIPLIGIDG